MCQKVDKETPLNKLSIALFALSLSFSGAAFANANDPLNIIGHYKCTGYDSHAGAFKGDLTFTVDEAASYFPHSFGAYKFNLDFEVLGAKASYSGFAAAQGQSLAMYFANDDAREPKDYGVGMAVISHDQDVNGNYTTTLHKSYYAPEYMRTAKDGKGPGGRGTEVCVKQA